MPALSGSPGTPPTTIRSELTLMLCSVYLIFIYQVHIVYDSRSDSPEHVGIPAVPVKVFSARQPSALAGETGGYTSDESQGNNSRGNTRANTRRHKLNKKEKIIWA